MQIKIARQLVRSALRHEKLTKTGEQVFDNIITRNYQGMVFQFREDGYFNMTKAAQAFGKRLQDFFDNKEFFVYGAT